MIEEFRIKFKELDPNYVHLEVLKDLDTEKGILYFFKYSTFIYINHNFIKTKKNITIFIII